MTKKKNKLMKDTISDFWITIPSLWHNLRAHIHDDAVESFGITAEQFHTMRRISLGIDSVSKLADDKSISRSAVSRAVDVLVQKGLVVREPHPQDRRRLRLTLTGKGQTLMDALSKRVREWMKLILVTLDDRELESIIQAFGALRRAFH